MADNKLDKKFIAARRGVIARDFSRLNDMQLKAVMSTEGPLLLLAGAGSGKTTVLINRIANLIRYGKGSDCDFVPQEISQDDIDFLESYMKSPSPEDSARAVSLCAVDPVAPWRIIAITFTNKAANELKSRLENMLEPEANDIWAMTFHSACVRILRREIHRLGFDQSFTIYDTGDSQSLVKRIIKDMGLDEKTYAFKTVLGYISRAKDMMMTAEEFYADAEKRVDIRRQNIGKIYMEYSGRLKAGNALDFDDIILFTVKLLKDHADVREYYQNKFRYVLIDEYQDTNNLQYMLASLLTGAQNNICVVGDDDQSIYKFRGATIENILNFENQYKNVRTIRLEQNYRSKGNILDAANAVIRNNIDRKGKALWTTREAGDRITLHMTQNEHEEAQYIAGKIIAAVAEGANWRDHVVLYRMSALSNQIEYAFKRNSIPYRMIGGTKFFERAEIKDMLSYICVVQNPGDDLRLTRIVNNPARGIGQKTLDTARDIALSEGLSIFEVLKNASSYPDLERSSAKLHVFTNLIDDLAELSKTTPLDEFYDILIEKTGYVQALRTKETDENISKAENVFELKSSIISFLKESPSGTLSDFLEEIALYTDLDQYDSDNNCVVLMTMHSAKGLEFPTVFVIGAEEGIFPSIRSIGEIADMEEERRLCYVAITRAMETLCITYARQRMLFGRTTANMLSRFIEEIPEENIDKTSIPIAPTPKSYNFESDDFGDREYSGSSFGEGRTSSRSNYGTTSFAEKKPKRKTTISAPPPQKLTPLSKGDRVRHKAFGDGAVISVQAMGGDALLEIEFEKSGKKRLMQKSAMSHMEKI